MESGKYISWFSSTFNAVSFFSEPIVRGKENSKDAAQGRLIHIVINTLLNLVVIDYDPAGLCIWTHFT